MNRKEIFTGFITGLLATASCIIFLTLILSDLPIENSWKQLYYQKKLGSLISLGALINLILFLFAIKKNKISFAAGLVILSLFLILLIVVLKVF